jgi:hypothetical protein
MDIFSSRIRIIALGIVYCINSNKKGKVEPLLEEEMKKCFGS